MASDKFLLNGKKVSREAWNTFTRAIEDRYGSKYGRIEEHLELALKRWADHLSRGDVEEPRIKKKSVIFGPGNKEK